MTTALLMLLVGIGVGLLAAAGRNAEPDPRLQEILHATQRDLAATRAELGGMTRRAQRSEEAQRSAQTMLGFALARLGGELRIPRAYLDAEDPVLFYVTEDASLRETLLHIHLPRRGATHANA